MEKNIKCQMCGMEHPVDIIKEKATTYIKGELVEYEETLYYCCNCDEDEAYYIPSDILNKNLLNARNAYRIKKGLLTSKEIVNFRKIYDISQVELSKIMDFGEATISRYESKAIQDEAHDNMLRIVIDNPLELLKLLEKNKEQFENHRYELIRSKIVNVIRSHNNEIVNRRNLNNIYAVYSEPSIENGYTILNIDKLVQVVNYFAKRVDVLNKVLLMKLLWYTDSLSFKENGVAITGLVYEHKDMGALPLGHNAILELSEINVQEKYSSDFNYPIYTILPSKEGSLTSHLTKSEINILSKVYDKFKHFTGKQIAEYMHKETAYLNTQNRDIITFSYAEEIKDF